MYTWPFDFFSFCSKHGHSPTFKSMIFFFFLTVHNYWLVEYSVWISLNFWISTLEGGLLATLIFIKFLNFVFIYWLALFVCISNNNLANNNQLLGYRESPKNFEIVGICVHSSFKFMINRSRIEKYTLKKHSYRNDDFDETTDWVKMLIRIQQPSYHSNRVSIEMIYFDGGKLVPHIQSKAISKGWKS